MPWKTKATCSITQQIIDGAESQGPALFNHCHLYARRVTGDNFWIVELHFDSLECLLLFFSFLKKQTNKQTYQAILWIQKYILAHSSYILGPWLERGTLMPPHNQDGGNSLSLESGVKWSLSIHGWLSLETPRIGLLKSFIWNVMLCHNIYEQPIMSSRAL